MSNDEFIALVATMRQAQARYMHSNRNELLEDVLDLEAEVDEQLEQRIGNHQIRLYTEGDHAPTHD